jgi:hypothetical protein
MPGDHECWGSPLQLKAIAATRNKRRALPPFSAPARRPPRKAQEYFEVVLFFDRNAANALAAQGVVGNPSGVRHCDNVALAGFGDGQEHTVLIPRRRALAALP